MAKKSHQTSKIVTSVGITTALAAAALGAYFLYGTVEGKKQRRKIRGWALKAKGEVLEKLENLKEVNEDAYQQIVNSVTARYKNLKNVNPAELASLAKELKGHWQNIQREFQSSKKTVEKMSATTKKQINQLKGRNRAKSKRK